MPFPLSPAGRAVFLAGALVLALVACGRRGPLEAPGVQAVGGSAVPAGTTVEPEQERRQAGATVSAPAPGGRNAAPRGYTVPKDPFILDPLL